MLCREDSTRVMYMYIYMSFQSWLLVWCLVSKNFSILVLLLLLRTVVVLSASNWRWRSVDGFGNQMRLKWECSLCMFYEYCRRLNTLSPWVTLAWELNSGPRPKVEWLTPRTRVTLSYNYIHTAARGVLPSHQHQTPITQHTPLALSNNPSKLCSML